MHPYNTLLQPDARSIVQRHFVESIVVKQQVIETCFDQILNAASLIATALRQQGKLLLCGNGRSAAEAHITISHVLCYPVEHALFTEK